MLKRLCLPLLALLALLALDAGQARAGVLRDAIALEESWSLAQRQDVQDALVWSGDYAGRLDGDLGAGSRAAIEAYQTRIDHWSTGYLTEAELDALVQQRRAAIRAAGFTVRAFPRQGLSIGLPEDLFGPPEEQDFGLDFMSAADSGLPALTLFSGPVYTQAEFRALYDDAVARDDFHRDIYQVFRGDWLVFTGLTGDGIKQYTYLRNTSDGLRGFAFFYQSDEAGQFDRIAVAMFNSLEGYAARHASGAEPRGVPSIMPPGSGPPQLASPEFTGSRYQSPITSGDTSMADPSRDDPGSRGAYANGPPPKGGGGNSQAEGVAEYQPVPDIVPQVEPEAEPRDEPQYEAQVEPRDEPQYEPEYEPRAEYGSDRKGQPRGRRPRRDEEPRRRDEEPRRGEEPRWRGRVVASGSGFYVNGNGALLTNNHVIEGCSGLRINGEFAARTVRFDRDDDLALVQAETGAATPFLPFRPTAARLNEDVTVIGFPLWGLLEGINVTRGSVSSMAGLEGDRRMVQITAPVQSGNSGGPVLDAMGRVVGVVQSKLDTLKVAEEMGEIAQNINFAIEGRVAQEFLTSAGAEFTLTADADRLSPPDLAAQASQATVLIECFK